MEGAVHQVPEKNDWSGISHLLPYSGEFPKGNNFVVFNNQIYLWKKIRGLQLGAVSIKP